jgi:hypothetical protein
MIRTQRLKLRSWRDGHRAAFAKMHADPKLDRYSAAYVEHGLSRWAVENADGTFLGYAGAMPRLSPCGWTA